MRLREETRGRSCVPDFSHGSNKGVLATLFPVNIFRAGARRPSRGHRCRLIVLDRVM